MMRWPYPAVLALAVVLPLAKDARAQESGTPPGPPPSEPVVYEGVVGSVNPPDGRVRLMVSRIRFPGVPDLVLSEALPALLLMGANGHATGGAHFRDLEPGRLVSVSVRYAVDDPSAPGTPVAIRVGEAPPGGSKAAAARPANPWPDIIFPVLGRAAWSNTFGAPRDNGARKHEGQDLMAPKMRPVLAAFDGTVWFARSAASNSLHLDGISGYSAAYLHLNNDRPGTDDGLGSDDYAIAPGLQRGDRVVAGQFLGWVGDSGNAEHTGPHLHFELSIGGRVMNAAQALRHASHLPAPRLPLPAPDVRPKRGEVRLDGTVRLADAARGVIQLDVRSRADARGRRKIVTFPERRWVRVPAGGLLCVLGNEARTADLASLAPGMPVIAIGPDPGSAALRARSVVVERRDFQCSAELAQAIRDYATRLAAPDGAVPPAGA